MSTAIYRPFDSHIRELVLGELCGQTCLDVDVNAHRGIRRAGGFPARDRISGVPVKCCDDVVVAIDADRERPPVGRGRRSEPRTDCVSIGFAGFVLTYFSEDPKAGAEPLIGKATPIGAGRKIIVGPMRGHSRAYRVDGNPNAAL